MNLFYIYALLVVASETFAWVFIERWSLFPNNYWNYLFAIVGYAAVIYFITKMLRFNKGLGVTNAIWNVFSTIAIAALGILLFSEKYSIAMIIGIFLGIASLFLLSF